MIPETYWLPLKSRVKFQDFYTNVLLITYCLLLCSINTVLFSNYKKIKSLQKGDEVDNNLTK